MFLAVGVKVQGSPSTGKYGSEFSGIRLVSEAVCLANRGQLPLSELAWLEESPHEMHWWLLGLGWGPAQVAHHF